MADRVRAVVVGSVNVDLHVRVPAHPAAGETVAATSFARLPGGKGGNQAAALARLGAQVRMHAAVGDDADGAWSRDQLAGVGVDVGEVRTVPGVPTGTAVVMVADDTSNRIVVVAGANAEVVAPGDLGTAHVLVAQLEIPLPVVTEAVSRAQRAGVPVVLNAAPARPLSPALLRDVDILVLNEPELAAVAPNEDPATLARTVVVTLGERGALVHADGAVVHVAAPSVDVVDTTGAGDCFVAALAFGVARGQHVVAATELACSAAAMSVRAVGARGALPTLEEVQAWSRELAATTPTTTTTRPPA